MRFFFDFFPIVLRSSSQTTLHSPRLIEFEHHWHKMSTSQQTAFLHTLHYTGWICIFFSVIGVICLVFPIVCCTKSYVLPLLRRTNWTTNHRAGHKPWLDLMTATSISDLDIEQYASSISQYSSARGSTSCKCFNICCSCVGTLSIVLDIMLYEAGLASNSRMAALILGSVGILVLGSCESAVRFIENPKLLTFGDRLRAASIEAVKRVHQDFFTHKPKSADAKTQELEVLSPNDLEVAIKNGPGAHVCNIHLSSIRLEDDEDAKSLYSSVHLFSALLMVVGIFASQVLNYQVNGKRTPSLVLSIIGVFFFLVFCLVQYVAGNFDDGLQFTLRGKSFNLSLRHFFPSIPDWSARNWNPVDEDGHQKRTLQQTANCGKIFIFVELIAFVCISLATPLEAIHYTI